MCYANRPTRSRRAFTLLEVTVSLILSAFVISAVFMIVRVNLDAVETMAKSHREHAELKGFESYLQACFTRGTEANRLKLRGEDHLISTLPSDELTFQTTGGNAAFSPNHTGLYQIRIRLKDNDEGVSELGLERWHSDDATALGAGDTNLVFDGNGQWIPLLPNVTGLDFKYFDTRQNQWIDDWKENTALPRLIKATLWTPDGQFQSTIFIPPINTKWQS